MLTKVYNQNDDGEALDKEGVATAATLDKYTSQTVYAQPLGYQAFAGQRDDGFYADIQSLSDLDLKATRSSTRAWSRSRIKIVTTAPLLKRMRPCLSNMR